MVVGVLELELQLHTPQSLKQKRAVIKSLLGRLRNRFPVSCAETGMLDLWQRARIGLVMVSHAEAEIAATLDRVETEILRSGELEITRFETEYLHYGS